MMKSPLSQRSEKDHHPKVIAEGVAATGETDTNLNTLLDVVKEHPSEYEDADVAGSIANACDEDASVAVDSSEDVLAENLHQGIDRYSSEVELKDRFNPEGAWRQKYAKVSAPCGIPDTRNKSELDRVKPADHCMDMALAVGSSFASKEPCCTGGERGIADPKSDEEKPEVEANNNIISCISLNESHQTLTSGATRHGRELDGSALPGTRETFLDPSPANTPHKNSSEVETLSAENQPVGGLGTPCNPESIEHIRNFILEGPTVPRKQQNSAMTQTSRENSAVNKNLFSVVRKPDRKKRVSKAERSGLVFPVARFIRKLKRGRYAMRIRESAGVYMSAVLEYLVAEVLELSGNYAAEMQKHRISPRGVLLTFKHDLELDQLTREVIVPQGGVRPFIPRELLPPDQRETHQVGELKTVN